MQLASVQMPTLKSLVLEQIYEEALITICMTEGIVLGRHSTNTGISFNSKKLMVTSFQAQDVGGSLRLGDEARLLLPLSLNITRMS